MDRRAFFVVAWGGLASGVSAIGCRCTQTGHVMKCDEKDMVGSHAAGSEVFKPLIDEAVSKLLARQNVVPAGGVPGGKSICFVGLENKSSEPLGDFKDQITQIIDTDINQSGSFHQISSRFVEAGLKTARLRPDELFVPANQRTFRTVMEQQGQPFDYLLFATLNSGTTQNNANSQKDYMLTFELVNLQTGVADKESAMIRKGYRKSHGLK